MRVAFRETFDLVLIHNQFSRADVTEFVTLNQAIAVYSVAAWERSVADIKHLAETTPGSPFGGTGQGRGKGAYLGPYKGQPGSAAKVLSAASNGELPHSWKIQGPDRSRGSILNFHPPVDGHDPDLTNLVDWCVELQGHASGVAQAHAVGPAERRKRRENH